jgi:hypothetical protein
MQGRVGVYIRNGALMVVRRRTVRCPLAPIMLSLLTTLLAFAICAHAATYTLYHRLQHLGGPEDPFIARGALELAGNVVSLESASTVAKDLALWTEKHAESAKDASGALYQIALSADSGSARAISSVKLVGAAYNLLVVVADVVHSVTSRPQRHKACISTCPKTTFHMRSTTLSRPFPVMEAVLRRHPRKVSWNTLPKSIQQSCFGHLRHRPRV